MCAFLSAVGMDSSLYLCSTCYQIFNSLEVVISHQLTCQPVNTEEMVPAAATGSPTGSNSPQNQTQTQNLTSPALLIHYQCRECEALFESLELWQKHSKLGDCSATTGSEPRDQEMDTECQPVIGNEKGVEEQSGRGMDVNIEEDGDKEREEEVDYRGGMEQEHSIEIELESETNSQHSFPNTPMFTNPAACSSNPTASSSRQTSFCVACGSGFSTESALKLHRVVIHGLPGALHHCDLCGKSFMNTTKYLYHRRQHRDRGEKDLEGSTPRVDCILPKPLFQWKSNSAVASGGEETPTHPPLTTPTLPDPSTSLPALETTPGDHFGPCPHCGRFFKSCSRMRTHIQAHSGLKPFKCDLCPKTFAYSRCVTHHRITHSARKPYTCLRCGKSYTLLGKLQTHHLLHKHQDALNKDGVVVKEDTDKEEGPGVVNDAESKNSKYPTFFRYKCPDCPRCFRMSSQVPVHRYSHTGKCPFTCSICGEHFFHKSRLKLHALTHNGQRNTNSVLVDIGLVKGTGQGRGRGQGRRRDKTTGLLDCEFCRHHCVTKEGLDLHRLSHAGQTPLRCPMTPCRRRYATAASLEEHLLTHCPAPGYTVAAADLPKPRPFHCHHCGKDFTTGSSLSVHLRVHTGEKPFQCSQCWKRFRQIPHLRDHERLHSGERPFVCGVCGKSFVLAARLTEHARTHSGEKPFSCPMCHRAFRSLSNLGKHRKTHRCCPPTQPQEGISEQTAAVRTILLVQPQVVSQGGSSSVSAPLVLLHPSVAVGNGQAGAVGGTIMRHAIEVIVERTVTI
uniref:Zinc finger protein 14-like n=1 Tax=Salmo trutta TaxID=8032 RepID=A0A674AD53_SALTR